MAKAIIKFSAQPYAVGPTGSQYTGYRPQLEPQQSVEDLAFCAEVVAAKRLSTSAEQLLHNIRMVVEAGLELVCNDGRPRGITGTTGKALLKFNRFANGNLESPSSAWNDTCKAYVKPQILCDAKTIDATFQNVDSGIGVKLDNVTWVGAQTVVNVLKTNQPFGAYGRHMEFDGTAGDTAKLIKPDGTELSLTCTTSDTAHAVFSWPTSYAPEVGTQLTFIMKSRGGVAGGEVYTSKKVVTVVA